MKKLTLLFALLCASVMGWAFDENAKFPDAGTYAQQFYWTSIGEVTPPMGVNSVESRLGYDCIYINVGTAEFNPSTGIVGCELADHDGAGVWVKISSLTAADNEIYFKNSGGTTLRGLVIHNIAQGAAEPGSGSDPAPAKTSECEGSRGHEGGTPHLDFVISYDGTTTTLTVTPKAPGIEFDFFQINVNGTVSDLMGGEATKASVQYTTTAAAGTELYIAFLYSPTDFGGNYQTTPTFSASSTSANVIYYKVGDCAAGGGDDVKPSMADATVTKVSQTHNSVVISITGAEDNVAVTKYVVKNHSDNSSVGEYTPAEGKITVSDLSPSTGYNWDIYAKDAAGNVSDNSKNISFTTDALVSNYCGETLTSTDNNATVDMSCEFKNNKYIITFTTPTLSGEASVLSGFNGSFCTIGGAGAHDARDHYSVNNSEKIVLEFDGVPNFYTDLYINIPGGNQRVFSWPNDVVWGTCPDVAVTGVTLNHDELNMVVGGGTQTLVATIAPTNATNQNVTWVSDDTNVATVENGVVTAVGAGTAHITVTTQDGSFSDQCTVIVTVPSITPVTYNGYGANKGVYALYSITRDYDQSLVFSAKVDAAFSFNKRVHYYRVGVADEWADLTYNSVTGTYDYTAAAGPFVDGDEWVVEFYFPFTGDAASIVCNYTVGAEQAVPASIPVGAVVLNKTATTLSVGETDDLTATVYPSFATAAGSVEWASDATDYATVDAGTVTAVAPGSANITATCGGVTSNPCDVTVAASLEETKLYGCGAFVNNAGKVVAYDYVFTRATNHVVTLNVVFSRSMSGIIGTDNFQMYVNGANQHLTYNDANRTATYSFGAQTESASINYYFYFVLDGGGVHQTSQTAYVVGSENTAVHAFAIGENDDTNVDAIAAADGQTFDKVFVARSFTAGNLYTLVLPFDVDAAQTATILPGQLTKLNNSYIKDNGDMRVNFVDVDAIEAGVPYLYAPSADVTNPVFAGVTVEKDLDPTEPADGLAKYYGIYAPMNGEGIHAITHGYVLGSDQYLYSVADLPESQTMKALRGYFVLNFPGAASAPKHIAKVVFNSTETQNATALEELQIDPSQCTKIMLNGLLYIVREGKIYNLQGQLVK